MKNPEIEVACGIIERDGQILIAQRKPGSFLGGLWEFPGGKLHADETLEECVVREIEEELDVVVRVREFMRKDIYDYPTKTIHLNFFMVTWVSGVPSRKDCHDFKWIKPRELRDYQFPVGDDQLIMDLIQKENYYFGKTVRNNFKL